MVERELKLGIFGVGRMGLVHLENLVLQARRGDIDLLAIGDRHAPTMAHAKASLERLGASDLAVLLKTYETPEEMAASAGLDAVVVASRTQDHVRDCRAFTDRHIPVLLEKPLAASMAEAAEFCGALGASGHKLVQLAFQRHHDPAALAAMRWFNEGRIGRLQQSHHVLQDKNPTPANYQSSGITADMAIHLIFEAMSFHDFELPRRVQAVRFMAPHYEDRASEGANVMHAFCQWADGSLAHLWGSRINNTGYDNGFKLIGTLGRIDVGEFVGDFGSISAKLWQGTGDGPLARGTLVESLQFAMTEAGSEHPDFYARYATAYAAELASFLDRVRKSAPLDPGPDVGWKTQLVADLAESSSRQGGRLIKIVNPDGSTIRDARDAAALFASAHSAEFSCAGVGRESEQ